MNSVDFDIISHYQTILENPKFNLDNLGIDIPIPLVSLNVLRRLCDNAIRILECEPSLMRLKGPIFIVGDLHGSLHDLLQILHTCGLPPQTSYLFLGDYVDRGDFSTETITLLLAMLVAFPENVFLLRGNHEFADVCYSYGFKEELDKTYKDKFIFDIFCNVFAYLPLGAIINDKYFCVHGGISPHLHNVEQLNEIQRPIRVIESHQIVEDILWSDPALDSTSTFTPSTRGRGFDYGLVPLAVFLKSNHLLKMIRGHQCVAKGIQLGFQGLLMTVFSASSYESVGSNRCGVLSIANDDLKPILFSPSPKLARNEAKFYLVQVKETQQMEVPKLKLSQCSCIRSLGPSQSQLSLVSFRGMVIAKQRRHNK
ncbi:Serine/threonine-protein phosphatase PP1 isozyme 9 [Tritrichomonas foetus]|uniref:Serine/threonine-protein phosphatase n=1 Tax=Tritrichomonas foetus TaxID=1144522 RepID=A0A1J4JMK5_9EUKA|nr:Serine/threonine-protein phosphatase PP1 isozyme 9 [Tritrichomonas foetus]|eukprot:OHS99929.1 Serine/threonine-protein phosphatase PP1 isozyme 9 [Tritrichomonas foetus]